MTAKLPLSFYKIVYQEELSLDIKMTLTLFQ